MSFHVPNLCRIRTGQLASSDSEGNNGAFMVKCCWGNVFCVASDGALEDSGAWEHVSVSVYQKKKPPTWECMCFIKKLFWDEDDCVIQYHPPKRVYVNCHPGCLHLWRPVGVELPMPPPSW